MVAMIFRVMMMVIGRMQQLLLVLMLWVVAKFIGASRIARLFITPHKDRPVIATGHNGARIFRNVYRLNGYGSLMIGPLYHSPPLLLLTTGRTSTRTSHFTSKIFTSMLLLGLLLRIL